MTTTDARPPAPARAASPVVRTGRAFLRIQLHLALWLWGIVAAIWVVLTVVLSRVEGSAEGSAGGSAGGPGVSTWSSVDQGPRWFLFAMALIMVTGYLPAHVANGMTRRSFTTALGVVLAVTSAGYAVLWTLGRAVERAVFEARGWPTGPQSSDVAAADGPLLLLGLASLVTFAVYAASGMLVGATYYRGGAWWGTLTLPLTVGPVLLAELVVSGGRLRDVLPGAWAVDGVPLAAGLGPLLLLAAALGTAAHLVIRDVPIRTGTG
jgi:hypothetical protein